LIVQVRRDALRVIRQLDHSLASGRMALAWVPSMPFKHALAVALHDFAWADEDCEPVRDDEAQSPLTFQTIGSQRRALLYAAGVARLAVIDEWAATLASLHYARFVPDPRAIATPRTGAGSAPGGSVAAGARRWATLLRHLDDLSLFVCLACPASESRPDWLTDDRVQARPDGPPHRLQWNGPTSLSIRPFPFDHPLELRIPCRDLPRRSYPSNEALRQAWREALPAEHRIRLIAG
jgi:hypothetical protein